MSRKRPRASTLMVVEGWLGISSLTSHTKEGRFNTNSSNPEKQGSDNTFPGLSFKDYFNELKQKCHIIQLYHSWVYIQWTQSQTTQIFAYPCLLCTTHINEIWNQPRDLITGEWIKENLLHIHNRILFGYKEDGNYDISRTIDRTGDHHIKGNKPNSERQMLYIFSHMQNLDLN